MFLNLLNEDEKRENRRRPAFRRVVRSPIALVVPKARIQRRVDEGSTLHLPSGEAAIRAGRREGAKARPRYGFHHARRTVVYCRFEKQPFVYGCYRAVEGDIQVFTFVIGEAIPYQQERVPLAGASYAGVFAGFSSHEGAAPPLDRH